MGGGGKGDDRLQEREEKKMMGDGRGEGDRSE